jgi:hypothetical protein
MFDKNAVFTMATKMGISSKAAASMRIRFLKRSLRPLLESYAVDGHAVTFHWIVDLFEEIAFLKKKANRRIIKSKNGITDSMIEQARQADPRTVIELDRNKRARAWCHEDRKPSLYFGDRTNKMVCPVCNKTFSALDILMERDGYSFIDAVRSLQ